MTYDFHGAWESVTGVNSPLYDGRNDPEPGWSVDGCAKNWVEKGAPKEKLNIGLAFYGRSFKDAKALGEFHGGADDITWAIDEGTPQYFVSVMLTYLSLVITSFVTRVNLFLTLPIEYNGKNKRDDNCHG